MLLFLLHESINAALIIRTRQAWRTDERLARHVHYVVHYVNSLAAQGPEAPSGTSVSHLATDSGSRSSAVHCRVSIRWVTVCRRVIHGLNSAWRLAQDRGLCRQLVATAMLQSMAHPRCWWLVIDKKLSYVSTSSAIYFVVVQLSTFKTIQKWM